MARQRIAVCDDEPSELEDIVQSVKRYDVHSDFDIENYTDGAALLSDLQLKRKFFDLLLLDIEMPSNGFQLAQTLTQMEKHPLVIFVTKRHEYAVQGYGIEACCGLPPEQRKIHLQLRKQYRSLFYRLDNPYSDISRSLRVGSHHGYGLKNVKRVVKESDGDFYAEKKNGTFTVKVRLNCEN